MLLEVAQHGHERGDKLLQRHAVAIEKAEPVADAAAAEIDGITAGGAADDADVRVVGPRTAVRAAGHPQGENFLLKAQPRNLAFQLPEDLRQGPLALGQGQRTGGQRYAGARPAADVG